MVKIPENDPEKNSIKFFLLIINIGNICEGMNLIIPVTYLHKISYSSNMAL